MSWSTYHAKVSFPISIRGITYSSMHAAAKSLGLDTSTIRQAKRNNKLDTIGVRKMTWFYETIDNRGRARPRTDWVRPKEAENIRNIQLVPPELRGLSLEQLQEKLVPHAADYKIVPPEELDEAKEVVALEAFAEEDRFYAARVKEALPAITTSHYRALIDQEHANYTILIRLPTGLEVLFFAKKGQVYGKAGDSLVTITEDML